MLRPFFTFYGGKWRIAPKYPKPRFDKIVEPFAGSAGYSLRYPEKNVVLVEKDPVVAGTWRYLTKATKTEILNLPDIREGASVDDLTVPQEAKWLIGWWCTRGGSYPNKTLSSWGRRERYHRQFWGPVVRDRIASQVGCIRHWQVIEGDWWEAPDISATWFVDPPYVRGGEHYRYGSGQVDYRALSSWCRERRGQVLVCEREGERWLPFKPFMTAKATTGALEEALWTNEAGYEDHVSHTMSERRRTSE